MQTFYVEKRFADFRELINSSAALYGGRTAFVQKSRKAGGQKLTYRELRERYYALCSRFLACGLRGKRIAILGPNSLEWVLSYLAAATVGVAVPLDKELHDADIAHFTAYAACAAICVADDRAESLSADSMQVYRFSEVMLLTGVKNASDKKAVDDIPLRKDEMQVLIFTSGTTGHAKGVCLSQFAICSDIYSTVQAVKIKPKDVTLSFLPLHHTYECTLNCLLFLSRGAKITYCDELAGLQKPMAAYRPPVLVVVPALLKLLARRIRQSIARTCPKKYRPVFESESLTAALASTPLPLRRLIGAKVRQSLGGRLRLLIVGAADLDTALIDDFAALGIRTLQGYGLTECAPLLAGNNDFYLNPKSTGVAMPGIRLKIDSPNADGVGEILAQGDNLFLGYFRDPQATADAFRDGYFRTGDLGRMDDDGALYIRGRIKNVIVAENGKNIYPEELESRLARYAEVGEALVVRADGRNGSIVKAKIFPNLEFIKGVLGRIPSKAEIEACIHSIVQTVNHQIPVYKRIALVDILDSPLEKTGSQKIKRCGPNLA